MSKEKNKQNQTEKKTTAQPEKKKDRQRKKKALQDQTYGPQSKLIEFCGQ